MHQVLFIAYDFPPCQAMGGALRSAKFVKYLPEFGWNTCVFTLEKQPNSLENHNIIRIPSATPYHKPYEVTPYGWAFNVYQYGKKFLQEHLCHSS